jgi:hypothetical protein
LPLENLEHYKGNGLLLSSQLARRTAACQDIREWGREKVGSNELIGSGSSRSHRRTFWPCALCRLYEHLPGYQLRHSNYSPADRSGFGAKRRRTGIGAVGGRRTYADFTSYTHPISTSRSYGDNPRPVDERTYGGCFQRALCRRAEEARWGC